LPSGVFFCFGPGVLYKETDAPTDYMVTQTIKADRNDVFTYAVPKGGWLGFATLNISDKKMIMKGEEKNVKLGTTIKMVVKTQLLGIGPEI